MALRNLAGKLRIQAAAALRPPSGPCVSPPAVSRFLAYRSSQVKQGSQGVKVFDEKAGSFYEKIVKKRQELREGYEKFSRATASDFWPELVILSSAVTVISVVSVAAYVLDVDDL